MRIRFHYLLFFLVLILFVAAKKNSASHQHKDFEVFKQVLVDKEGRLDLHTDLDSVYYYLDLLDDKLKTELSILNQYKMYASTLSKIQCGHTQIHPNKEVLREWLASRNSLPIDYFLIGNRLIVNSLLEADDAYIHDGKSAYEKTKKIEEGSEIISIDGKSVVEMMKNIGQYLSSDENSIDFKYFQAAPMFEFYRHLNSPFKKDSIRVCYITKKDTHEIYFRPGTAPVHTMNARLTASSKQFEKNEANMGEFKIEKNCGYFRFTSFKLASGKAYEDFLHTSFKKLKNKNIKKLIIDLRGNTGGAMQYSFMRYMVGEGVYLGKYIVEKPKNGRENRHLIKMNPDYFKHKRISKTQRRLQRKGLFSGGDILTKSVDSTLIYNGGIVVITDEGTFSSASMLACHLKSMKNAKILGRRAGGSFYSGNAGTLLLQLPESELKLFINPNTFYSHLTPSEKPLKIKEPDIILNPLIIDRKKRDAYYLKEALRSLN